MTMREEEEEEECVATNEENLKITHYSTVVATVFLLLCTIVSWCML